MTDLRYHIIMRTGLALSIDGNNPNPGNQLILNNNDGSDPDQFWSLLFTGPNAYVLYNPGRKLYAAPQSLDDKAPVILFPLPPTLQFDAAQTWEIVGSPYVIRSSADEDRNLNASGDEWKQGTPIIVYHWGGGEPNEVWDISLREYGK